MQLLQQYYDSFNLQMLQFYTGLNKLTEVKKTYIVIEVKENSNPVKK